MVVKIEFQASISLPFADDRVKPEWKKFYMVGGPLCFGLVGLLPLAFGFDKLGNWGGIVTLFVLQGVSGHPARYLHRASHHLTLLCLLV